MPQITLDALRQLVRTEIGYQGRQILTATPHDPDYPINRTYRGRNFDDIIRAMRGVGWEIIDPKETQNANHD